MAVLLIQVYSKEENSFGPNKKKKRSRGNDGDDGNDGNDTPVKHLQKITKILFTSPEYVRLKRRQENNTAPTIFL